MKLTPFLFGSIDRKEESAALPSREGAAALLGVLASWFEGSLRNYWWWDSFRPGTFAKHAYRPPRKIFRFSIVCSSTLFAL
jgi:hypothetical protein